MNHRNKREQREEWLDIVDVKGVPTGEIVERTTAHREGIRHRSSHVWLFREREGRVQILLQMRSPGKDSFPSCYDISSAGHIPAGIDFVPSALRELREELGVEVAAESLDFCGQRSFYYEKEFYGTLFKDRQVSNVYALWLDWEEKEFILQPEEVASVKWFDFEECMTLVRENKIPHCIYVEELELLEKYLQNSKNLQNNKDLQRSENLQANKSEPDIRNACTADLERILEIYDIAKEYMRRSGNPHQWNGAYPDRATLEQDIRKGQLYVYCQDGVIHGVFVMQVGDESTYAAIENGDWLNAEAYITIHRLAGDGTVKGIFEKCLAFCKAMSGNIRIDTHHDNHTMQHLAEKNGFQRCGIIHLANGAPRIAYQYVNHAICTM